MPALKDLYVRVVQHKTDVIEHLFDPRWSPGMERGSDERARVSMGLVDREEGKTTFDTRRTEDPSLLLHAIEDYVVQVLDLLEAHTGRSVLCAPAPSSTP